MSCRACHVRSDGASGRLGSGREEVWGCLVDSHSTGGEGGLGISIFMSVYELCASVCGVCFYLTCFNINACYQLISDWRYVARQLYNACCAGGYSAHKPLLTNLATATIPRTFTLTPSTCGRDLRCFDNEILCGTIPLKNIVTLLIHYFSKSQVTLMRMRTL